MPASDDDSPTALTQEARFHAREPGRKHRVMVLVDVVESVRLMREHEEDFIRRWQAFLEEVQDRLLPAHRGRLVKSLGDGLLMVFEDIPTAVNGALALQDQSAALNQGLPPEQQIWLRCGVHAGAVHVTGWDIFGRAVDLTARLAALAQPGGTVASVGVRDGLVPGLTVEVRDLGECFLKHIDVPVRCFELSRVDARRLRPDRLPPMATDSLLPGIAVLPFSMWLAQDGFEALGDALAEHVIVSLSQRRDCRVVSRLSTAAFRQAPSALDDIRRHLDVAYVVRGSFASQSGKARLQAELCEVRTGTVLWADAGHLDVADFFAGQDPLMPAWVQAIGRAIQGTEMRRARSLPLQTLESYTLYISGSTLLHRLAPTDFAHSRHLLMHLHDRAPRAAAPQAMLAKWHILRMTQGWATELAAERTQARQWAERALQIDPGHAFALAVDGLVAIQADGDLTKAEQRFQAAIESDPQEPYAWAAMYVLHTYQNDPVAAEAAASRAISLSPLDPQRFMFDCYLAVALTVARKHEQAIAAAERSIQLNRSLTASYRILAVAQVLAGQEDKARGTMQTLLVREPGLTVSAFLQAYPGRHAEHAQRHAQALRTAGMPA